MTVMTCLFCGVRRNVIRKTSRYKNTHGTGCTLSSAIASYLAQGHDLISATTLAKSYISQAIKHSDELDIGKGHGPVHHFFSGHADVR